MERRGHLRIEDEAPARPPHDLEVEKAVIGAMLMIPAAIPKVLATITYADFYSETHRKIFDAIRGLAGRDEPVDQLTTSEELKKVEEFDRVGGRKYLFELVEAVPTGAHAERYAKMIKKYALARSGMDVAGRLEQELAQEYEPPEQVLSEARDFLDQLLREDRVDHVGRLNTNVDSFIERIEHVREKKGLTGVPTGLARVDHHTGGWQKGRVVVIGARTNAGKTLVLNKLAVEAATRNYKATIHTPEMHRNDVLQRAAGAWANVPYQDIKTGDITDGQVEDLKGAALILGKLDLFVDSSGTQTVERIKRRVIQYEPELVIVDYLQRIEPTSRRMSRNEQVAETMADLASLANDFDVAVIVGCQVSRGVEYRDKGDRRPQLNDLRDSGVIEDVADAVIFLYRDSFYSDDAPEDEIEFLCKKDRHGDTWGETFYLPPGIMDVVDKRSW